MKIVSKENDTMVLVSEPDEEVLRALTSLCIEQGIEGAVFNAIGAVKDITLAYYDLSEKEYRTREFADTHELVSAMGNVGLKPDGEVFAHTHGVLADPEMNTQGGHIVRMTTAVTCEVVLQVLPNALRRTPDERSGLDLLDQ